MQIKPGTLTEHGYVLQESLGHSEIIPFVRIYLKKRTFISHFYTFSNVLIAFIILFWFWMNYGTGDFRIGKGVSYFSFGLAIAFALIPLHEFIHVLAYKSQGAIHTSYDVNWKKFYFMAVADGFVADRKEFRVVALAPFVVISATLIILMFFAGQLWSFSILGALLAHTAFSSGDFGLLSFFAFHKNSEMVTYDDKENRVSFFYAKSK